MLRGDRTLAEIRDAVAVFEVHRQRTDGHSPWASGHVGGHVQGRTFKVVAHVVLQVAHSERLVGFNPQREVVAFVKLAVNVRQVFVHLLVVVMVAEEAPHAGIGVAHILEVDGAVGIAEREIDVLAIEEAFLAGEGNHIKGIDTFHFGLVNFRELLAIDAPTFFLRELPDSAQVGMGADAVVGDAQGHPNGTFAAWALADDFHNPSLVGVTNGDGFAAAVVAVFFNEFGHALDGFAGSGRALQG